MIMMAKGHTDDVLILYLGIADLTNFLEYHLSFKT